MEGIDAGASGVPDVPGFTGLREIGRGGFSVVYAAEDVTFGRRVALKVLTATGGEARRVEREARALGSLSDVPNVVQVHQVTATDDGRPVLVMELMARSLGSLLRERGAIPLDELLPWLDQVATALDRVHLRGVLHRDLKPDNILLGNDGQASVVDFGIAGTDTDDAGSTTAFSFSPPYAPPERFTDAGGDGLAGDLYGLAATFFALCCGAPPFGTATTGGAHGLILRVVGDPVPRPEWMPREVHAVFARAMDKDPGHRYGSATEFAGALRAALDGVAPTAAVIAAVGVPTVLASAGIVDDPDRTVVRHSSGEPQPEPQHGIEPAAGAGVRSTRRRNVIVGAAAGIAALALLTGVLLAGGSSDRVEAVSGRRPPTTVDGPTGSKDNGATPDTPTGPDGATDGAATGGAAEGPVDGSTSGPGVTVDGATRTRGDRPARTGSGGGTSSGGISGGGNTGGAPGTGGGSAGGGGTAAPAPAPVPAAPQPTPAAPPTPVATPPAPPVTATPVARPTSCTWSNGVGIPDPWLPAFGDGPSRIRMTAAVRCSLNVGGTRSGALAYQTNFASVGFGGGTDPNATGTIAWDDGSTTGLSGPATVGILGLNLGLTPQTTGFGAGARLTMNSGLGSRADPTGKWVVQVDIAGGSFNWG